MKMGGREAESYRKWKEGNGKKETNNQSVTDITNKMNHDRQLPKGEPAEDGEGVTDKGQSEGLWEVGGVSERRKNVGEALECLSEGNET
jgi:hypothetical protein